MQALDASGSRGVEDVPHRGAAGQNVGLHFSDVMGSGAWNRKKRAETATVR
jgi:hypothetical protein